MLKLPELKWYVYCERNSCHNSIVPYNVFYHGSFRNEVMKLAKECKSLKVFSKRVKHIAMYYFWSKSEYEIILTSWPPYIEREELDRLNKEFEDKDRVRTDVELTTGVKIDIYDQLLLNWDAFIHYTWIHRKNLIDYYDYITVKVDDLNKKLPTHVSTDRNETEVDWLCTRILDDAICLKVKTISIHPDLFDILDSSKVFEPYIYEENEVGTYSGELVSNKSVKNVLNLDKDVIIKVKCDKLLYPGMIKMGKRYIKVELE